MKKAKGRSAVFDDALFLRICDDYLKDCDKKKKRRGKIKISDVIDYYSNHKGDYQCPEISAPTFYTKQKLKDYIRSINDGIVDTFGDTILKNDEAIYEDFDWRQFYEVHKNQEYTGLKLLGETINRHRKEIISLINSNDALTEKVSALEEKNGTLEEKLVDAEDKKSRKSTSYKNLHERFDEIEKKYGEVLRFLKLEDAKLIDEQCMSSQGITTITDDFWRAHSFEGEPDKEVPPMEEMERRFGEPVEDTEDLVDEDGKINISTFRKHYLGN